MAEALGTAGTIVGIVTYGLHLGTSLQTYEQGYSSAKEKLCELGVDISATASALLQLQHVIESDKNLSTKVLKDEGVQAIEDVAAQCENIYKTVIILVNKAGNSANKGKVAADFGDKPVLKPSNLLWDMRSKWLNPRVKRIQEQIRWVKMKILLNLQLAGLAKVQLGIPERAPGSFNEELALRLLASRIRRREVKYLEKLATKYRIREMLEFDSPYNASVLSIPDYVPPPVPVPESEPAGFPSGPSNGESSSNPFRPGPPGPPVFMGDRVIEILDDTPEIPPERPRTAPGKKDGPTGIINVVMPSPKVAASISRSNTMVPDQQSERGAADLKDATTKVEVEEVKPVKPASDIPPIAPREELAVKKDDKPKEDATAVELTEAVPIPPLTVSQQSFFPTWLRGMFGQTTQLSNDWESQTLEAFIIPENSTGLLKVPFGHQSLAEGLRRVKKQCLPWDQYTALGSQHHKRINQAVLEAKRLDSRERTCLAVGLNKDYGAERIMLFFLVGAPVDPIHLKDAVGRKYTFPYEQARTWTLMKALIDSAFLHVDGLGNQVNKAQYDLINEEGKIVLPEVYEQLVKPGSSLSQHMWPMLMPPGQYNRRPAGLGMPPGPPLASNLPNTFNNLPPGPPPPAANFPLGPPRPPGGGPPPGPTNNFFGPPGGPGGPPVIVNLCRGPPGSRSRSRSRRRPPPPGVLGWMAGTKSEDPSFLAEDSDIEDEPVDLGLEIDFDKEDVNAKLSLGDLLAKLTNATDTVHDFLSDEEDSSDDDSSSGSGTSLSLVSD